MSLGFLFGLDTKSGFASILDHKGNKIDVPIKQLPRNYKVGQDVEILTGKRGHSRVTHPVQRTPDQIKSNPKSRNSATDRQQYAMQRLVEKGWSPEQASGVVGRFMQESFPRLDTNARGDLSIPGASVGIGQWNRERKAALLSFAKKNGGAPNSLDTQLDFFDYELRHSPREKWALMALEKAGTPEEASAAMMHYERPRGYSRGNPRGGHGFKNTVQYANSVMSRYDPNYKPSVDTAGTTGSGGVANMDTGGGEDMQFGGLEGGIDDGSLNAGGEVDTSDPNADQGQTFGEQISADLSGLGTQDTGQAQRSANSHDAIMRMIQEGQQAQQGGLPGLPTFRDLFGDNG